jgi:hypothetical protein
MDEHSARQRLRSLKSLGKQLGWSGSGVAPKALRLEVVSLFQAGISARELSETLGVKRGKIHYWVHQQEKSKVPSFRKLELIEACPEPIPHQGRLVPRLEIEGERISLSFVWVS